MDLVHEKHTFSGKSESTPSRERLLNRPSRLQFQDPHNIVMDEHQRQLDDIANQGFGQFAALETDTVLEARVAGVEIDGPVADRLATG